jgi:hypothetical protein
MPLDGGRRKEGKPSFLKKRSKKLLSMAFGGRADSEHSGSR